MQKYLKPGTYTTAIGKYKVDVETKCISETENETYFLLKDEQGNDTIVLGSKIQEEEGSYSTGYSSASDSGYTGTDTIGGRAKQIKKKKKPVVMSRNKKEKY